MSTNDVVDKLYDALSHLVDNELIVSPEGDHMTEVHKALSSAMEDGFIQMHNKRGEDQCQ